MCPRLSPGHLIFLLSLSDTHPRPPQCFVLSSTWLLQLPEAHLLPLMLLPHLLGSGLNRRGNGLILISTHSAIPQPKNSQSRTLGEFYRTDNKGNFREQQHQHWYNLFQKENMTIISTWKSAPLEKMHRQLLQAIKIKTKLRYHSMPIETV